MTGLKGNVVRGNQGQRKILGLLRHQPLLEIDTQSNPPATALRQQYRPTTFVIDDVTAEFL